MIAAKLAAGEVSSLVAAYLWPFLRVVSLVSAAPVFGVQFVPAQFKILLAVAITILVVPLAPAPPAVEILSMQAMLVALQQILIGLAMGMVVNLLFNVFLLGGQIIGTNMGLGFATVVDPQGGVSVPVLSQFYVYLTTLIFLALNGHLLLIEVLTRSFTAMPVAGAGLSGESFWQIVQWAGEIFKGGTLLALPALASLLLVNMALGVIMRAAPQFNIMSIGFPITLTVGFIVILVSLPTIVPMFNAGMVETFNFVERVFLGG